MPIVGRHANRDGVCVQQFSSGRIVTPTTTVAFGIFLPVKRVRIVEIGVGSGNSLTGTSIESQVYQKSGSQGLLDITNGTLLGVSGIITGTNTVNGNKFKWLIAKSTTCALAPASSYQGLGVALQLRVNMVAIAAQEGCTGWFRYEVLD